MSVYIFLNFVCEQSNTVFWNSKTQRCPNEESLNISQVLSGTRLFSYRALEVFKGTLRNITKSRTQKVYLFLKNALKNEQTM